MEKKQLYIISCCTLCTFRVIMVVDDVFEVAYSYANVFDDVFLVNSHGIQDGGHFSMLEIKTSWYWCNFSCLHKYYPCSYCT